MTILSVGEILWDVFEQAEHIGGAPFNFAAHAARLGHEVHFISAVGEDDHGRRALRRVGELGLSTRLIRTTPAAATGTVTIRVDAAGQPNYTIHRPAAYDFPKLESDDLNFLAARKPAWVCFGTLAHLSDDVRRLLDRLLAAFPDAKRLYDINLRKDSFSTRLIEDLMQRASLLKINDDEVRAVQQMFGPTARSLEEFCRDFAGRFGLEGVCVTRGAEGCALLWQDRFVEAPGYAVKVADAVGAGDAFAAALVHGISQNWEISRVADFANRLGALVASRSGAVPDWKPDELSALLR